MNNSKITKSITYKKFKEEVLNASEEARDMDLPKESILFDDVYYENGINK